MAIGVCPRHSTEMPCGAMHHTAFRPLAAEFLIHPFRILLTGDHLFDSRQRVPVGGQESQHVPAGYAASVVDPVITGLFSDRSGVTPRVLTAPSLKCTQHQRK